jgi:peptidoglycan/LPS O-acetylase OafA/YrhL
MSRLDRLHALAVTAVLLYHAELSCIPGSFLGVEVFFVISGYLIIALLLAEHRQRGRVDLKAFGLRVPAGYSRRCTSCSWSRSRP